MLVLILSIIITVSNKEQTEILKLVIGWCAGVGSLGLRGAGSGVGDSAYE